MMSLYGSDKSQLALPPRGLFITGTDTDVGKTYVAAAILRQCRAMGYRVGGYKPVASGHSSVESTNSDGWRLWDAAGRHGRLQDVCPQTFAAPLAPHLAARAEGRQVDDRQLLAGLSAWANCELAVVEGVGGLMSPVSDHRYVADLADDLRWPVIVVVRNRIGAINQTLQTLIVARHHGVGLIVAGIVLNDCDHHAADPSCASNASQISLRCDVPLLAHVRHGDPSELTRVDWRSIVDRCDANSARNG